ncbi:MAG TPA: acyl-CoA dehydrogenase family protein [Myxococcota bacterium]|nr:acyl-CoA dehydrogenase family protein [Myxococcota bacterium]
MISFGPTEEQSVAREAMREFASKAMRPIARDCDETASVPDAFLQSVWELGLTATQIPEAYGGAGEARSPVTNALVLEELAYGDVSLALAALAPSLFANAIVDLGSEAQKRAYLPLFSSERFHAASLALLEPSPAFDVLSTRTVAEPKGDGFVLSGRKSFVPLGERASHFLVLARCGAGFGFDALDAFILPRDVKGLSLSPAEKNLGLRALATTGLVLDRVEVPAASRLGGERGIDARRLVNASRAAIAIALTGLARAVSEYCIPYAKERVAFGEAIAKKQAIAFALAEMRIETDAMRLLAWKAASQLEHGQDATKSAQLARDYAAEECMKIADNGVQVLGGHGYIREHPVEMWYRNARTLGVLEGTVTL